ncbi:MAG: hypothetical protein ACR2JB_27495 [Bryobacteraceae bacterium]
MSPLAFRFKDGSVDDETAIFSQRGSFRLINNHHIQKGPMFPKPTDVSISASTGHVTVRYKDNGQEKIDTEILDLPPDLANGIIFDVLKNIPSDSKEAILSGRHSKATTCETLYCTPRRRYVFGG